MREGKGYMDTFVTFMMQNWFFILLAIFILFFIVKIVKLAFRLVILVILVLGVLVLLTDFTFPTSFEEVKILSEDVKNNITKKAHEETMKQIVRQVEGAEYATNEEGDFTISFNGVVAYGNHESEEVTIHINGQAHTMKKNEALKHFQQFIKD